MKSGKIFVQGTECYFEIVEFLDLELGWEHKSDIVDGVIFFSVEFSYMTTSDLMVVTRVQRINRSYDHCEVEIVSGGGGGGIMAFTWGNEKRKLHKIADMIVTFCQNKGFKLD